MATRINANYRARLYAVHSWSGILFGLLLYAVSFSGVTALFHDELFQWERPEVRQGANPSSSPSAALTYSTCGLPLVVAPSSVV